MSELFITAMLAIRNDVDAVEELGDEIATLAAHIHAATQRLLALIASRVATPETEGELLALARGATTAQLERMVRAWKKGSRKNEAEQQRERHESRTFSVFPNDEGMYVVQGRLTLEVGALLMRALEAAGDALHREQSTASSGESAQRRVDAVGLLAARALAAGLASGEISGIRAQRYQVMLHVEPERLSSEGESGCSDQEDGTHVSAESCRRLSCDAVAGSRPCFPSNRWRCCSRRIGGWASIRMRGQRARAADLIQGFLGRPFNLTAALASFLIVRAAVRPGSERCLAAETSSGAGARPTGGPRRKLETVASHLQISETGTGRAQKISRA